MKGLFLKDFYAMKSSFIVVFFYCICLTIFAYIVEKITELNILAVLPLIIVFSSLTLSLTLVTLIMGDRNSNWTKFVLTSPVSKKEIIDSKYIEYILCTIIGIIFSNIIIFGMYYLNNILNNKDYLFNITVYMYLSVILSFICGSILIPVVFLKYKEKSIMSVIIMFMTAFASFIISFRFNIICR